MWEQLFFLAQQNPQLRYETAAKLLHKGGGNAEKFSKTQTHTTGKRKLPSEEMVPSEAGHQTKRQRLSLLSEAITESGQSQDEIQNQGSLYSRCVRTPLSTTSPSADSASKSSIDSNVARRTPGQVKFRQCYIDGMRCHLADRSECSKCRFHWYKMQFTGLRLSGNSSSSVTSLVIDRIGFESTSTSLVRQRI